MMTSLERSLRNVKNGDGDIPTSEKKLNEFLEGITVAFKRAAERHDIKDTEEKSRNAKKRYVALKQRK